MRKFEDCMQLACHMRAALVAKGLNLDQMKTQYFKPSGNVLITAIILVTLRTDDISVNIITNVINIIVFVKSITLDILNNKYIEECKSLQIKQDVYKKIMWIDQQ